jgi:hypothetical protein
LCCLSRLKIVVGGVVFLYTLDETPPPIRTEGLNFAHLLIWAVKMPQATGIGGGVTSRADFAVKQHRRPWLRLMHKSVTVPLVCKPHCLGGIF